MLNLDEVEAVGREVLWVLRLSVLDRLEQLLAVLRVEGRQAGEHFVNDRSQAPPVDRFSMSLAREDFWGQVLRRAAEGVRVVIVLDVLLREAEVGEFRVAVLVDEHVFRLEAAG